MESLLKVKNATKRFKNNRGVREVSFELAAGDVFGLIGPNGAGKTTLLKLIAGLLRPDSGTIELFGRPAGEWFEESMSRVGCVIEAAGVYTNMSAYDQLRQAARFYPNVARSRIDQVLEQVGLAVYRKEKAGGYSLGMKQRLALAGALLHAPKLVILDEPANGLDIEGMAELRAAIRRLAEEDGVAFLLSSHLVNDLGTIATRIGIMCEGSMIRTETVRAELWGPLTLEHYAMSKIRGDRETRSDEQSVRQHA